MPTYQYACKECGHSFEQVQSFTDDALTECPQCQGRLRKLFNAVGVVFKGSGFYRTDSRGGSGEGGSSSETTSGSKTDSSTTTDSKPAGSTTGSTTGSTNGSGTASAGSGTTGSSATKSPQPAAT